MNYINVFYDIIMTGLLISIVVQAIRDSSHPLIIGMFIAIIIGCVAKMNYDIKKLHDN